MCLATNGLATNALATNAVHEVKIEREPPATLNA